jgi:Fe2+ transport system protein FeoA
MKMGFMFDMTGEGLGRPGDAYEQPLAALPAGGCGRVVSVELSTVDLERLEVMGLCAGRLVSVIKPGDPMIVRVLGTRIGLAATLARSVRVRPEAPAASQRETA